MQYLHDQEAATGAVPDDHNIVIERYLDDMGDWRVCILSHFGARVHAPWAMAIGAMVRERNGDEPDILWTNDGIVVRFPGTDQPPPVELLLPDPDTVSDLVQASLAVGGVTRRGFDEAKFARDAPILPQIGLGLGEFWCWRNRRSHEHRIHCGDFGHPAGVKPQALEGAEYRSVRVVRIEMRDQQDPRPARLARIGGANRRTSRERRRSAISRHPQPIAYCRNASRCREERNYRPKSRRALPNILHRSLGNVKTPAAKHFGSNGRRKPRNPAIEHDRAFTPTGFQAQGRGRT